MGEDNGTYAEKNLVTKGRTFVDGKDIELMNPSTLVCLVA